MAKILCEFNFDGELYVFNAELTRGLEITDLSFVSNPGRRREAALRELVVLVGNLLRSGLPFETLERAEKLSPLMMSIVAAVQAARGRIARALAKSGAAA